MSEVEPSPSSHPEELPSATPSARFERLPDASVVASTAQHLEANGFRVIVASSGTEARAAVEKLLPNGAEVFDSTSVTLDSTGISRMIQESGKYRPLRPTLLRLRAEGKKFEQRRLGSSPDFVVGSVHAITESGQVVVASGSGSQLAPYAFGAEHVVWVVGTQKIVRDLDEAFRRIYDYALPKESERVRAAYGIPGSSVSKLLIMNREFDAERITVVLVNERLGY
ncbi:MAG: LUD domain-containing protein [Thermoplasmata archaeon]